MPDNRLTKLSGLTIVNNNAGNADEGLALLVKSGAVRKVVCSFPRQVDSWHFDAKYHAGEIELELVPQGNLAERIRAAGAGIGAFFTPSGFGTTLADGKETRHIDGRDYVLEYPIKADYALIKAHKADRWGNLLYRKTSRNFGPIMAMAATSTSPCSERSRFRRKATSPIGTPVSPRPSPLLVEPWTWPWGQRMSS